MGSVACVICHVIQISFFLIFSRCLSWNCVVMCVERRMCWLRTRRVCGIARMRVDVIRMRVWVGLCVVSVWRVNVCVRSTV